jgi:membrane protein DedA with SNARE-associated domain
VTLVPAVAAATLPLAELHPLWLSLIVIAPLAVWLARRFGVLPGWGIPVAVIAVVLGIVLGPGIVEIPSFEDLPLQRWVEELGDAVGNWAYAIVGLLAFLETGAFVGLVAPGETFVILGGVLAGEGTLGYVELLGVVWLMAFLGDLTSFYLGRRLGRAFLVKHGPRFKITERRLTQVEAFFDKHGGKAVVIGRFLGFIRAVAPFVIGSSGVRARRFVPYSVIGSGLWAALFVTLGYVFWQSLDQLLTWAKQGAFVFGTVIVMVVAVVTVSHWLREPEHREQAAEWLRRAGETRAGRLLLAVWRPISGPARFAWHRVTPGGLGLELTTLTAIAAVGAFAYFGLQDIVDREAVTAGDRGVLRWIGFVDIAILQDLARVGMLLASPVAVAVVLLGAVLLLLRRRQRWMAGSLFAASVSALVVVWLVRSAGDRPPPSGALDAVTTSTFPSVVGAVAVVWVAVGIALTPFFRGLPGRVGLTGVAIVLAVALCFAPLVRRVAYLSDVLAGAGLAAAVAAAVAAVTLVVFHVRQNLSR